MPPHRPATLEGLLRGSTPRAPEPARVAGPARVVDLDALRAARRFEEPLGKLCQAARLLPAVTAQNAASERQRLVRALQREQRLEPRWELPGHRVSRAAFQLLDGLRDELGRMPARALYEAKLDELELDLRLIDALGDGRRVAPLARRRFGCGAATVPTRQGPRQLSEHARALLAGLAPAEETRTLPAESAQGPSLTAIVLQVGRLAGLDVKVQVEPRLAAAAATGDMTVYLADRRFGARESLRLAVHEVLGHVVSAANGRAQPLRLLEWGTAGGFADQEGAALYLEHAHGLMDDERLRTLAARVVATDMLHAGASFADTVRALHGQHGFTPDQAVALGERAYRGGGVARDAGYLRGFECVRDAIERGEATLDELRCGRVSLCALPQIRLLHDAGLARASVYRPNFSRSLTSTSSGTTPVKSPPSAAASLMRLELT